MKTFKIHQNDNVAVCIEESNQIPRGHKIALNDIKNGENIIKYGFPIGHAICDIKSGSHVHSHNMKSNLGDILEYQYNPNFKETVPSNPLTFMGYKRENGSVGIRNEVWIIPTVGCVNSIVCEMEKSAQKYKTPNIDGIYAYNHPYGCSQLGDDQDNTLKFLSGLIRHPNAAAVLVVGLGCENANINELKKHLGDISHKRVEFLVCQECDDELIEAEQILKDLCAYANGFTRSECDVGSLTIGLKCGGSDGLSGITANSLLGEFTNRLVSMGGNAILTEVPEMFGAETILMERCRNKEVFDKTVNLINGFKRYFLRYGEKIDENPSPGNKEGGITTLEDKSLGCVQKGGNCVVEDVLSYGERVSKSGLSLLYAPGNDLVASNALVSSGAQIILFTTGRGTPFGCPAPTVKISSNTPLFEKKEKWIDFDAGILLSGKDMNSLCDEFFEYIISVASGTISAKSENLSKTPLAIFKDGVTL